MSTLHSLSEWRLTTWCPPPTKTYHLAWSSALNPRTAACYGVHRCGIKIFPCLCAYGDIAHKQCLFHSLNNKIKSILFGFYFIAIVYVKVISNKIIKKEDILDSYFLFSSRSEIPKDLLRPHSRQTVLQQELNGHKHADLLGSEITVSTVWSLVYN